MGAPPICFRSQKSRVVVCPFRVSIQRAHGLLAFEAREWESLHMTQSHPFILGIGTIAFLVTGFGSTRPAKVANGAV